MTTAEEDQVIEFIALVEKMRLAQTLYFQHRERDMLVESKRLEKQVDEMIAQFKGVPR